MLAYKISKVADADLVRIFEYGLIRFGIVQADKYYDLLYSYFDIIAENPYSFEAVDHISVGYRRCVCKSNYILYSISDNVVEIQTIVGNQDMSNIL